jgi:CheB methylesterase
MPKSDVNLGEDYSGAHEEGLPAAAPDLVEERERELIDNIVPTLGYSLIPMVGLGGSAGSAAIILSGADGDGAIGIKRIKERGGVTIAQDPEEAEHHGMPQSEIATGMVDCVLRVAEMPQRLLEYHAREQDRVCRRRKGRRDARPKSQVQSLARIHFIGRSAIEFWAFSDL